MNRKLFYISLTTLLALLLSVGGATGQGPGPEGRTEPLAADAQPQGAASIAATVNSRISYQGRLQDGGNPVTGSRDMTFRFYSDDVCATQVGSNIVKSGVQVTEGLFSVELDVAQDDFNGQGLWLQVEVDGDDATDCREIMPVPYALSLRPGAKVIGNLYGASIHAQTNRGCTEIYCLNSLPSGVFGYASASSGANLGVYGLSDSTSGQGVYGWASATSGATKGVSGRSDSSTDGARGVYGYASAASGETYGVCGHSDSTSGIGVFGNNNATSGATYGVYGRSASTSGRGVYGRASATSGAAYGVYGKSASTSGRGVYGYASATSGATYGVYGQTDSSTTGASGVYGNAGAAADNVTGVTGRASASSGNTFGVRGLTDSTSGIGVYGWASANSGTNYGVFGATNSASGYAGYFSGNVHINGTLSKSGGSFKIDHPLDPENKYLSHSFVESPDMMNVYNGNVALDENGQAWVALPDYFEALNQDFRYQLTPIGVPGPNLYIAEEISGNRFKIAGGQPGSKVSWQVTGTRQDPWANAYRIPVEEKKPADERGYYLSPELYGQPESKGIEWLRGFGRR